MTFKPEISEVTIYNEALALLPADPVQDPDERSLEARECRRVYKGIVATLLERHHWNLATSRVTLASVTNDRTTEWRYAYAKPTDLAFPVKAFDSTGRDYMGWTWDAGRYLVGNRPVFMQSRGVLFSNIETATLEYTSYDITEADFTSIFKDIVVLELAARVCHPITKDQPLAKELATRAEIERSRAIAIDLNRNQPTYGGNALETELVRGAGFGDDFAGTGYPLDPVAFPSAVG